MVRIDVLFDPITDSPSAIAIKSNGVRTMTTRSDAFSMKPIREGHIIAFYPTRSYGFIADDEGGEHLFFLKNRRETNPAATTRRTPGVGDRVTFEASELGISEEHARTMSWSFAVITSTTEPKSARHLPVIRPTPAATFFTEPLDVLVARQTAGHQQMEAALASLHDSVSETMLRLFCAFALTGRNLWDNYWSRKQDCTSSSYTWADYIRTVVGENLNHLIGPKSCELPTDQRVSAWIQALQREGVPPDTEVETVLIALYLEASPMLNRYASACMTCPHSTCRLHSGRDLDGAIIIETSPSSVTEAA